MCTHVLHLHGHESTLDRPRSRITMAVPECANLRGKQHMVCQRLTVVVCLFRLRVCSCARRMSCAACMDLPELLQIRDGARSRQSCVVLLRRIGVKIKQYR